MDTMLQTLNVNSTLQVDLFGQHFNATGLIPCVLVGILAALVIAVAWRRLNPPSRRRRSDWV